MIKTLKEEASKILLELEVLRIQRDILMDRMCKPGPDETIEDEFFELIKEKNKLDQDLFDIQYQIVHGNH